MFRLLIGSKKILSLLSAIGIALTATAAVFAQYQIKSWTTDDGLPQNTVGSILQTPDGYLWMTTLDGLARFDGVKFTVFNKQNTPGITGNRFNQLLFDSTNGDLWIATEDNDVTRYRDGVFEHFEIAENQPKKTITNLVFDERGQLLALTATRVFAWNSEKFMADAAVSRATKDKLALTSKNGALWYIGKQTVPFIEPVINGGHLVDHISTDVENTDLGKYFTDRRGRLWIGTKSSGLLRIENGVLTVFDTRNGLPSNRCFPQIEDEDGNLWATTDKGAAIIAPDSKVNTLTTENGLSGDSLTIITEDREGGIWIGTEFHGLNRVSRSAIAFFSKRDGLAENVVHPIFEDDRGDVWLGGRGLSVWRGNRFSKAFGRDEVLAKGATAITQDRAGRLWFGNWGGIHYYENGKPNDFSRQLGTSPSVFAIRETADGALWFATSNGLFRRQNGATTRFTVADGLAGNDVKVIHESSDGTLWFGAYGGLSRYKDGVFTSYTTADGLASDALRSLYEDAGGALWIGSYDGGLTRLKDGKFTRYTTSDGLFNNGVFQILEDAAGNFWMSSNRGIYRVAKQQLDDFADGKITRVESIAYNKSDGLLETECNGGQQPAGIKARDGKLWFPTQGGVAVIDPEKIKINPLAPPVVVETIKIDNEPVKNNGAAIEIEPGKNNLEIAYTGLSFVKPEFVKFRYKIAGLDKDWVEAGNRRTAYYSYLPPGAYDFQVIAANSDGVWNTEGATLKIVVVPPFYRTWWFWVLSVCLIAGAAGLLYRRRIVNLEKKQAAQQFFSQQLIESQERERQRIAGELHDGLSQNLVIIKNRAMMSLSERGNEEYVFEQIEEIVEAAGESLAEVRVIANNLRPFQIDRLGLTKAIEALVRKANTPNLHVAAQLDNIDGVFAPAMEINLYRIVQESLNNIIKHSEATEAIVTIKKTAAQIEVAVKDDGKGFNVNDARHNESANGSGFGITGIFERARMFGATPQIESSAGNGTIIRLKIGGSFD